MAASEVPLFENKLPKKEDEIEKGNSEIIVSEEMQNSLRALLRNQEALKNIFNRTYYENNWGISFPPPSLLKAYNEAFENGAHLLFLEIQKISDHKIAMDKIDIPKKLRQRGFGQIYGFVIAICFLIASFILVLMGFGIYGTIIGSVNLVGLVTIFVLNKSQR